MAGRTVTLAGFAGSGKSTVGRILAMRLKWPFKDTDAILEDREQRPLAECYARLGEEAFRDLERRVVLSTPDEGSRVMAVGEGGFNEETIPSLDRLGPTIHLDLSFDEARRRMARGHSRWMLSDPELFGLFIRRKRWYGRARYRVWTDGLSVDEVVDAILRLI